jgi:hypothetical protein
MIAAIMRRRLPAGQGKRTATFVSWQRFLVVLRLLARDNNRLAKQAGVF